MFTRLRYETAIPTFVQLAVATFFVILGGVADTVENCDSASDCVANSFLWLVIAFMVGGWFIAMSALGYLAQTKRNYKLARLLIAGELFTAFITFMLLKNPSSPLSFIGSAIIFVLAIWTIVLAWRLYQARGARIVAGSPSSRPRRRPQAK